MRKIGFNLNVSLWPILLLGLAAFLFLPAMGQDASRSLSEFTLKTENGRSARLSSLKKESEILVLVFVSSNCPVTTLYWERFKGAWYNYRDKGIAMIAVGGNSDDVPDDIRTALKTRDFELPIFWDDQHQLAKQLGIDSTPLAVILGKNLEILYRGRIDDFWRDEKLVKKRYFDEAIAAALEGRKSSDHLEESFLGSKMR